MLLGLLLLLLQLILYHGQLDTHVRLHDLAGDGFSLLAQRIIIVDCFTLGSRRLGIFSIGFFNEMIKGLIFVSRQQNINNISADMDNMVNMNFNALSMQTGKNAIFF